MKVFKRFLMTLALAASVGLSWGAPANAKLPGKFSVSATQVVYFSRGNLQYTRESTSVDWSTGTFRLATNQYDMIETNANPYCTDNCGDKTVIGLFGWGTWGEGKTPNLTTNDPTAYTWSTDFTGMLEGYNDWRTLSKDEWVYLLDTRATGVTVNATADARYTMATINTDGTPVTGLIIFPDAFAGAATAGVTWGTINDKSDFATTCTAASWTALEQAGCVFLPACGQRSKINATANVRTGGCGTDVLYYTCTVSSGSNMAHNICFTKSEARANDESGVRQAFGVRLVSNNAPAAVVAPIAYNYPTTYSLFGIPEGWSVKVNDEEVAVVNGAVKNIAANDRFDLLPTKPEDVKLVEIVPYLLDLATVTDNVVYILDGDSITGTANGNISIVIVPDAKVYFKGVNLTNTANHPAVLCGGNAEIVVVGENTITCTTEGAYGIRAAGAGTTLTLSGDKAQLSATIDPNGGTVNQ